MHLRSHKGIQGPKIETAEEQKERPDHQVKTLTYIAAYLMFLFLTALHLFSIRASFGWQLNRQMAR